MRLSMMVKSRVVNFSKQREIVEWADGLTCLRLHAIIRTTGHAGQTWGLMLHQYTYAIYRTSEHSPFDLHAQSYFL